MVQDLRRDLRGWQIFFIVASVIIGEGIFSGDGKALRTAGPAGALLALFITSIITICMMECCSELVQLFPCPNAIVKYIEVFVDPDLAIVCGIAYWYTWASVFGALNLTAAGFTSYWNIAPVWAVIGFYILAPLVLFSMNLVGVSVYGWIETIGGILKITLVFGTGILMYALTPRQGNTTNPINDGFQADHNVVSNPAAAVCLSLPIFAYSVLGHEAITVTAAEAKSARTLRRPSQLIAYFIFVLYTFAVIAQFCMVGWKSGIAGKTSETFDTNNMAVLATQQVNLDKLAGVLNGCYIFSVLSASNSALYIASRVLYGLTRELDSTRFPSNLLRGFSTVVTKTGVPAAALLGSLIAFFWVPFLRLKQSNADEESTSQTLLQVLETTSSVSCLMVWACLCLAFIRYQYWLRKCRAHIQDQQYLHYNRDDPKYGAFTFLAFAQPIPAYVGLVGSLLIVFIFTTAPQWKSSETGRRDVAIAYAAPLFFVLLWITLKLFNRRPWVRITDDFEPLHRRLRELEKTKEGHAASFGSSQWDCCQCGVTSAPSVVRCTSCEHEACHLCTRASIAEEETA